MRARGKEKYCLAMVTQYSQKIKIYEKSTKFEKYSLFRPNSREDDAEKAAGSYKTRIERKEKEPDFMICSQWVGFRPLRVCSLASGSEARFADLFGGELFRC